MRRWYCGEASVVFVFGVGVFVAVAVCFEDVSASDCTAAQLTAGLPGGGLRCSLGRVFDPAALFAVMRWCVSGLGESPLR